MATTHTSGGHDYTVPEDTDPIDVVADIVALVDSMPEPVPIPNPGEDGYALYADGVNGTFGWEAVNEVPASTTTDSGKVLTVDTSGDPTWEEPLQLTNVAPSNPGAAAVVGTGLAAAHEDHVHRRELPGVSALDAGKTLEVNPAGTGVRWNTPAAGVTLATTAPADPAAAAAVGTGTTAARADHAHAAEIPAHAAADAGKVLAVDAQGDIEWTAAASGLPALGTSGQILTVNTGATDVEWADPASGLPAFVAADASKHLAVNAAGAAVGWVDPLALSTTAPVDPAAAAAVGTGTTAARADHAHLRELPAYVAGDARKHLRVNAAGAAVEWTEALELTTTAPLDPAVAAAVGTGTTAARADHVHHQELPPVTAQENGKMLGVEAGAWATVDAPGGLPAVTAADNDKELQVKAGAWAVGRKTTIAAAAPTAGDPGDDGDLWFVTA